MLLFPSRLFCFLEEEEEESDAYLTKVSVRGHPADRLGGDDGQQAKADKGANPREEKEKTHDGALHGLGGCRISELQPWNQTTDDSVSGRSRLDR